MILLAALAVATLSSVFPDQPLPVWPLDGTPQALAAGNLYQTGAADLVTVEKTATADYRIYVRAGLFAPWASGATATPEPVGGRADPPPRLLDLGRISYPGPLAIADVDDDGWPDILAGTLYDRRLFLIRQRTRFVFAPPETLSAPPLLQAIVVGRMTPAGRRDVAAIGADSLVILPQQPDGGFGPTISLSNLGGSAAAGDIDNDGRLEILTAEPAASRVRIWRVDADGQMRGVGAFFAPQITVSMMLVDLDGDGYRELVRQLTGGLVIHRNLFGAFAEAGEPFGERGKWLGSADMNADGRNDLVVGMPGGAVIHSSMPGGDAGPGIRFGRLDIGGESGVAADLTGDALPDVAVIDAANRQLVLLPGGGGHLDAPRLLATTTPPRWLLAGDWDGDGLPEIALRSTLLARLVILDSYGSPLQARTEVDGAWSAALSADVTGDGRDDLVLGEDTGAIRIMSAAGGYPFRQAGSALQSPIAVRGLSAGDFNGDAIVDFIVTATPQIVVMLRTADGRATAAEWLYDHDISESPHPVDFDDDGDLDLLTRQDLAARVVLFPNDGTGHFGDEETLWPGDFAKQFALSDVDADGHVDVVTVADRALVIHWGRAGGRPEAETRVTLSTPAQDLAIADFTGDGIPELVVSDGTGSTFRLLTGEPARQVSPEVAFSGTAGRLAILPFDWSLDGWPDLVVARRDGTMSALQLLENVNQAPRNPLIEATAIRQPGRSLIRWTSRPFGRHRRWRIHRGPDIDQPQAELTPESLTDSLSYSFVDSLVPDESTRYWLREEQDDRPAVVHGPYEIPALPSTLMRFQAMARLDSIDVTWRVNEFGAPLRWRVLYGADVPSLAPAMSNAVSGLSEYRLRLPTPAGPGVWALEQVSRGGGRQILGPFGTTPTPARPLALGPAWPNPSRGGVTLRLFAERAGAVQIRVFDVQGRLVEGPIERMALGGEQEIGWDGRSGGRPAPAGLFWIEVRQGARRSTIRITRSP